MKADRYHRQTLLPQIGQAGQARLRSARVLLVGCGALGTVIADQLVRAGIAALRLCDRDVVEITNLQRQTLFDQSDVAAGTPKAIAAERRLKPVNSEVAIDSRVVDVHGGNIEELASGADLILDGTDNAETRYLVNDAAVKLDLPWVYGACVGTTGRVAGIVPGKSPCLRCLFPEPPGVGELPTCDTAGVLAAAASVVASIQVVEAMKLLLRDPFAATELTTIDLWPLRVRTISTVGARRDDCPTCAAHRFDFLDIRPGAMATSLCGRNTVQVRPAPADSVIDVDLVADRLEAVGSVERTPYLVRCSMTDGGLVLTMFRDGRVMVHGTNDPAVARSVCARFIGN